MPNRLSARTKYKLLFRAISKSAVSAERSELQHSNNNNFVKSDRVKVPMEATDIISVLFLIGIDE